MTKMSWTENLICPRCGKTGCAQLSEAEWLENNFDVIPDGFEVVASFRGRDFQCSSCHVPVMP